MSKANLQEISILSKVAKELENYLGVNDQVLVEFIIELAKLSVNYEEFAKKLNEYDAEFNKEFSQTLYNLIKNDLEIRKFD